MMKILQQFHFIKRALKGIGYLPQESSIFKDLSVEREPSLAAEIVIKDKERTK